MDIRLLAGSVLLFAPACLHSQGVAIPPTSSPSPSASQSIPIVDSDHLIVLLPDPPAGWNADKPEGSTTRSEGFPISTVSRTYVKGDADNAPTATINIVDSANNQQFQAATKAMWSDTGVRPDGYDKAVTVQGLPGFEHYSNTDRTGVLWVIAAGRFFVQVETTRLPASDLETWLSRIDLKKLSTLK